jgi:acyl-ACP thioesterase
VTDIDILGHLNNAAYWEAVEEVIARSDSQVGARRCTVMEYREPVDLGSEVTVRVNHARSGFTMWLITGEVVAAVASLHS